MSTVITILFIVALIFGIIEVVRAEGRGLLPWAVTLIAAGLVIARLL